MADRYYLKESSGYLIFGGARGGSSTRVTEFMVLDRAYCHRVVYSSLPAVKADKRRYIKGARPKRRATVAEQAALVCAELNAADRADG